jgi:PAS domain S-box-containing protein
MVIPGNPNTVRYALILLFIAIAIGCLVGAVYGSRLRRRDTQLGLRAILLTNGLWLGFQALGLATTNGALSSAIYVGGLICGLTGVGAWMYFASAYTGRTYHRNRRYRGLAVGVYAGLLVVKLTNPIYGLYVSTELQQSPYTHLVVEPQLFYWVSFSLTYTLVAISFYWLITTLRESTFPSGSLGVLAVLALFPILPRLAVSALPSGILPPIMLGLSFEPLGVTAFLAGVLVFVGKPFRQIEQSARSKFFEQADDATFVYDTDGRLVELNAQAQELQSAIDTELETIETFEQAFTPVSDLDDTGAIPIEIAGSTRYFAVTANQMATGVEVVGTVATVRDITERRARERELESFQRAVEEAADGVAILDGDEYVYVDQTHVEMYGFDTVDELLGDTWRKLYDDDEVARLEAEALPTLQDDGHWRGMVTGSRPDGSTFPAELSLTVVADGRLICTVRDETERLARERELELKKRAMDEANVGIQISDATQEANPLIYVNDGFERTTGYTSEEALGRNQRFLQSSETDPERAGRLEEAINAEEPVSVELKHYRSDGAPYWARTSVTPVTDEYGTVTNYIGIQQDVTEQREREQQAEARVDLLERLYEVTTDPQTSFEEKINELLSAGRDHLDLSYGFLTRTDTNGDPTAGTQTILEAVGDHERLQSGESGPLSESYCQRTVGSDGAMALTNAAESELVDEESYDTFGLETYLGGNVIVNDDVYGTLCFASSEQRESSFDEFERTFVSLLGQWVGYEIERRDARERLEDSRRRYQTLLQAAPDPILVADAETGEIVEANAAAAELRGQSRDDLIGRHQTELHPKANIELYADVFENAVGDSSTITELPDGTRPELVTFDGETVPVEISAASVALPDGPVIYGVFRDVSDREERRRELELKERAMDEANVGITISDPDREDNPLIYVNDGFVDQTGYTREDVLGRNCRFLQGDDRDQPALDELRDAIATDEPVTVDLRNYRKDGEQFWNRLSVTPVYKDGELVNHIGIQQDVTDEVRRKQRLYEERERFRLLTESVDEYAFLVVGEDGRIRTWNVGAENLFGYDADAALGMSMAELHPESGRESGLPERLRQQARLAGESAHEGWQVRADGSEFYADVRYAPLESDDGEFRGYAMIVRDMTDRRRQRRRTERFVEESEDVVNVVDPDGTITYASGSAKRVFGYDPGALVGENLFDYLHPGDQEHAMETFYNCAEGSTNATTECRLRSPDGEWLNVEVRYRNMLDDDAIDGMLVYLRDVSEKKERARRFESIFNQTFQFTGLLEPDGTVLEVNDAALDFGGFEREEIIGKPFFEARWWTHSETVYDEVRGAIERAADGEFVRYETEVRGGDGLATIDFSVKPVTDEDEDVSLLVVEGRDVTGQRQRSRHLRVMQRVMRHNMRNDLGKVRGWTELMSEEPDAEERAEQFGRVEPILDKWDSMTEKMREINRALQFENGELATTASGPLIENAADQVREEYAAATILTDETGGESVQVPMTLRKAVYELVENAVKVEATTTVEVTVRSDEGWVEISVTDDGPGMPEMEADVLETGEEDPLNHGKGLGLWMVRMIVTQAGGNVSVEPTVDGTDVRLRMPERH